MSFIGAVASSVRQTLARYSQSVSLPCLIIGAGNFTVPSVLRSGGYAGDITACDVSLYTSALGAYLSGWTLGLCRSRSVKTPRSCSRACCATAARQSSPPPSPC